MVRRVGAVVTGLAGLFTLGCVASADFARAALNGVSLPAMAALHRLTAPVPFPVVEPLALGLLAVAACALLRALASAAYRRSMKPLKRCVAGLLCGTILLTSALALLWAMAAGALSEETASSLRIDFTVQPSVMVAPGDVTMTFVIENITDRPLRNVTLSSGDGQLSEPIGQIGPGETQTLVRPHTVTEEELDAGEIAYTVSHDPMLAGEP